MENLIREMRSIEQRFKTKTLSLKQTAEYLSLSDEDIIILVSEKQLTPISTTIEKFKPMDIAKYLYGFGHETFTEKVLIAIDTERVQALQSPHNLIDREEFEMAILNHGEGSVYYDNSAQKFKCAFYYLDPMQNKKRKIVSAETKEDAIIKVNMFKASVPTTLVPPAPAVISPKVTYGVVFQEYWEFWSIKKREDITKIEREQIYNKHILPIFKDMSIAEIKPYDVQKFLNNIAVLENGTKRSTYSIRKIYTNLNAVFTHARESGYIKKSPTYGIDLPEGKSSNKDDKYFEESTLVEHLVDLKSNPKYYMMAMIFLSTGLRPEEFLVLRWSNIDLENKTIKVTNAISKKFNSDITSTTKYVYEEGNTKNKGSIRTIYFSDVLANILNDWKQYVADNGIYDKAVVLQNEDYVLLNSNGGLFGYNSLLKNYHKHIATHGIYKHKVNFYMFRHSYATYMSAVGVDTPIISSLMGHSNSDSGKASITESVYISIMKDSYVSAIDKYEVFLKSILAQVDEIAPNR